MQLLARAAGCAAAALTVASGLLLQPDQTGRRSCTATSPEGYYWPHARGHPGRYSTTDCLGPMDLNASLSWSWHHPDGRYHTTVTGAPLFDHRRNIYLATEDGIRKFDESGKTVWHYAPRGAVSTCTSLMGGAVFGNTQNGWVFSLDMETGRERWASKIDQSVASDTAYVEAFDGVVVTAASPGPGGGALRLFGLDPQHGTKIWHSRVEQVLWNFMPVFPGDDSFIVMDVHGGVYKHALHNSTMLWHTPPPEVSKDSFSDGGVILGPDGTAYTCSNYQGFGQQGQRGAVRAYSLADGHLLWDSILEYPCNSWPVVASDGRSVLVPSGSFVDSPAASKRDLMVRFGKDPVQMSKFSLSLGESELKTYKIPEKTAAIRALDAQTGEPKWSTELPPYGRLAARGDEEGYLERKVLKIRDQCLPAQFGSPTLAGDGTLYVGRADGRLYAVEASGTGRYQTFSAGTGFLHPGTSFAPGMMAVASCDGLFVWKY